MENIKIRLADENDIEKIYTFINKSIISKKGNSNKLVTFTDAFINLDAYNSLAIRFNLYNYKEEFFIVQNDDNNIKGIISFRIPDGLSKCFSLSLMILEDRDLLMIDKIFEFAIEKLLSESIVIPSKIRININNGIDKFTIITNNFLKLGFSHEAIRKGEINSGDLITSLVLYLNN